MLTSEKILEILEHNTETDLDNLVNLYPLRENIIEKLTELETIKEAAKDLTDIDYFTVPNQDDYFLARRNLKNLVNQEYQEILIKLW